MELTNDNLFCYLLDFLLGWGRIKIYKQLTIQIMKWEYKRESCHINEEIKYLASMGNEGWELVQILEMPITNNLYYWKRPIKETEQ